MARRPNQVSMPNPEFGVDFDASARAMHQSASKGSLMVHEKAFSMPAVARKSLAATMFERNTMLKTLKRKIALVAVAALGSAGLAVVAAPAANAANLTATATVTPVRVTSTAGTQDAVPRASLSFTTPNALTDGGIDAFTITVTSAPTSGALVNIGTQTNTAKYYSDSLATNPAATGGPTIATDILTASASVGDTLTFPIWVTSTAPGTYSGTLLLSDADANADVTVSWSFTTTGAPATISLDKSAVNLPSVAEATTANSTGAALAGTTLTITVANTFTAGNLVTLAGFGNSASGAGTNAAAVFNTTHVIATATPTAITVVIPAVAADDGNLDDVIGTATSVIVHDAVVVSLKDAAGKVTQPATGDSITASVVDATNIVLQASAAYGASYTITDADLADSTHTLRIASKTATADSETITFTPAGVLGATGVTAVTGTATTIAYGTLAATAASLVTAPSASAVILKNASTAQTDYSVDPGTSSFTIETSGLEAGKAYRIGVLVTEVVGGGTSPAGTVSVDGETAAAFTLGTVRYKYGVASATGKVTTVIALTTLMTSTDHIQINVNSDDTTYTQTSDVKITAATSQNTITLTSPATTPSVAVTGSTTTVAGTIKDQYGNAFAGATVTVVGDQTVSSGTDPANLTAQAVTDATGAFSVNLAAVSSLATTMALTVDATRGGVSATQKTATINFNAGGAASAITWAGLGDEDTAVTATKHPLIVVPFDGTMTGAISDELWDVATGKAEGDADANNDECWALEVNTTPLAQVTFTGSEGVLFSKTTCIGQKVSDATMVPTVTVASKTLDATPNSVWITSKKVGLNTVTMTSGSVTKTIKFYAQNFFTAATKGEAARDIVLDSATKSLSGGEIGFVTATVVDTFGNPVAQAAAASTVKASITGAALLDGPSLSKSGLVSDADGKITLGIIAGNAAGTATLTVTGVNVAGSQFGALVGAVTSTTTAGTDATFKASANVKTATITVTAASAASNPAIDAVKTDVSSVKADVKAVSDTVATLSKAVTTVQSSVTELTSSFATQIKSLTDAIAKISRAIAALQKSLKKK